MEDKEKFLGNIERIVSILSGLVTILLFLFDKKIEFLAIIAIILVFLILNKKFNFLKLQKQNILLVFFSIAFLGFIFFMMATSQYNRKEPKISTKNQVTNTVSTSEILEKKDEKLLKVEKLNNEWEKVNFKNDYFSKKIEVSSSGRLKTIFRTSNNSEFELSIFSNELNKEVFNQSISSSDSSVSEANELISDLSSGSYEIRIEKSESYREKDQSNEKIEWKNDFIDFSDTVTEPNNSIEEAMDLKSNSDITSSLTLTDEVDFYKFETTTSGSLKLVISAYMDSLKFELLDKDGKQIDSYGQTIYGGSEKEPKTEEMKYDLESGTYILKFEKGDTGKYNIKNTFNMGASNDEKKNDNIENAYSLKKGEKRDLFMSMQDEVHYFKLDLPESSKIEAIISAEFESLNLEILSSNNLLPVEDDSVYLSGTAKDIKTEKLEYDLDKGSYIIKIGKRNGTGKYSLIIN